MKFLILLLINIIGVYLLSSRIFNRRLGLLAAWLFLISSWRRSLVSSGETKVFWVTVFLTYGLWLTLKLVPKFAIYFLVLASLLMFFILYPDFNFWLKHGFFSDPTIVPIIHNYIDSCHQVFSIPVCRLIYNKGAFFSHQYLLNYWGHFSPDSLFITTGEENLFFAPYFYLGLFSILFFWQKNTLLTAWIFLYPLWPSFTGGFDYFHSALGLVLWPIVIAFGFFRAIELVVNKEK